MKGNAHTDGLGSVLFSFQSAPALQNPVLVTDEVHARREPPDVPTQLRCWDPPELVGAALCSQVWLSHRLVKLLIKQNLGL